MLFPESQSFTIVYILYIYDFNEYIIIQTKQK